ncbi:MAG: hypothetical protein KGL53_04385 [Elusimicrobia bacterium]|nr:hypothetical protein [Elusimicrobiota bacterium]
MLSLPPPPPGSLAYLIIHGPEHLPKGWVGVLTLFVIPIGGGIPGGVLLAKARHIGWPGMEAIYFVSDVILACVFEPLMHICIAGARRVPALSRAAAGMRRYLERTSQLYGSHGGPLTLILIAFGVDPMTGRSAAAVAGHGFFSGWTLAITGDMMYFSVIMVCTLWLRWLLGDGTTATIAILVLMVGVPLYIQKRREKRAAARAGSAL